MRRSTAQLGIFTEVTDDAAVEARAAWWAQKAARMPADGIVIAKEAFRLVEQLQGYQGEEVASYLFHSFGTNLQFEDGEFNFVKTRAKHGAKEAFEICKEHFEVPSPDRATRQRTARNHASSTARASSRPCPVSKS